MSDAAHLARIVSDIVAQVVRAHDLEAATDVRVRLARGQRLRQIRWQRGLTVAQLARLSGMSRQQIYALEKGLSRGSAKGWRRLADALGVDVEDLVHVKPEEYSNDTTD